MLRRLSPLADKVILARPENERSLAPAALLPIAMRYHRRVEIIEKPEEALLKSLASATAEDLICVTGSLYLIGAAKRFFSERCGT